MKRIIYNILFSSEERRCMLNAIQMRDELNFYQNSPEQNRVLKITAQKVFKKLIKWM